MGDTVGSVESHPPLLGKIEENMKGDRGKTGGRDQALCCYNN